MARIDREELARRYSAGERSFAGAKLDLDLSGMDLSGADLSGTRLEEFCLDRAILRSVNFSNARLTDSSLDGADLTGANLRGVDLRGARFGCANLTEADLRGVRINNTDFTGANLTGADLRGLDFKGCSLKRADLTGANLEGANLSRASFDNTIMPDGRVLTGGYRDVLKFGVVISASEDGYYADCPELEGCQVRGETLDEAQKNIKAAIEAYLEAFSPAEKRMFIDRQVWAMVLEIEEPSF
jgi:uncharacterized protein YjbI with pentapeptide repeats